MLSAVGPYTSALFSLCAEPYCLYLVHSNKSGVESDFLVTPIRCGARQSSKATGDTVNRSREHKTDAMRQKKSRAKKLVE